MEELREALAAAVDALAAPVAGMRPGALSDADYVETFLAVEAVGRLVDAARVLLAGEAQNRGQGDIDTFGALGFRGAVDAVAGLAGVSEPAARQRIRVGAAISESSFFSAGLVPPRYAAIASAVREGRLGVEAAGLLIGRLDKVSARVDDDVVHAAEDGLVALACGDDSHPPLTVDLVDIQAAAFVARIDPDGARPREERARRNRSLRFGRETVDGLIPVHGALLPEVGAQFQRLCDAHIRAAAPTFADPDEEVADLHADGADGGASGADVARALRADERTRDQKRHDVLGSILDAAARVADAPSLAGAPPSVIVTVSEEALRSGHGAGFIDGAASPVSLDVVERRIDDGGVQAVVLDAAGAVLSLGSVQRCFTPSQRRAITARDGGCLIPGCAIPAGWCEVHHVVPHREGGATHVDNGVLLCWWHHHRIDAGPWRLRMEHGVPQIRGPGHPEWTVTTKRRADAVSRR